MYNYRRVYTNTSKFKTIYGDLKSPVFLDYRIMTVFAITVILNVLFGAIFGLFTLKDNRLTLWFFVFVISVWGTYYLDQKLKKYDLPFETTIRYGLIFIWRYWFRKKQLYQDKRLNSNNKRYQIL